MAQPTHSQSSRHLVLLDIENMTGTPVPSWSDVDLVRIELEAVIPDFDSAQCIVACSHIGAEVMCFSFPKALRRLRSGPDGADLALIDEMLDDRIMTRYDRVTLCSGDRIFATHVARLGRLGVDVTVVARQGSFSAILRIAAANAIEICNTEMVEPAVAVGRAS